MIDQNNNKQHAPRTRSFRALALAGTAVALVVGGAVFGGSLQLMRPIPAYADAVQVQNGITAPDFSNLVDQVSPAVVSVRVTSVADASADSSDDNTPFFNFSPNSPEDRYFRQFRNLIPKNQQPSRPQAQQETALGSGFLISDDGYIVTNNHVIDHENSVTVILNDGTELKAKVVGADPKTDIALLKVTDPDRKFTYVKFADAEPKVGEWVVAMGNPYGLEGSVTAGIVSGLHRQLGGPYDNLLQIDAAVNHGNSGGPAFNENGEVIGINTSIFSPSGGNIGIAFAIPASTAKSIVNQLETKGSVVRGWIGVQVQGLSQTLADSMKLKDDQGALVNDVTSGSPADKAGLQIGDTILAIDGQTVKDSRDLALKISAMEPGKSVKVTYWRDGASHDVDMSLGTFPSDDQLASASSSKSQSAKPSDSVLKDFGLTLAPSDDNSGVVVSDVDPNGVAAEAGLQPGDVILSVGSSDVAKPADVETQIAAAKADGLKAVRLRVQSGDQTEFVALAFNAS
jgi:serine protease Do